MRKNIFILILTVTLLGSVLYESFGADADHTIGTSSEDATKPIVNVEKMEAYLKASFDLISEYSGNETLLETIRRTASKSNVFPIFIYEPRTRWHAHLENSFDRYLPFYLFKTKVGTSTLQDIQECVDEFEGLNTKEKAYVLAAIVFFEKAKRQRAEEVLKLEQIAVKNWQVIFDLRKRNGHYVPKLFERIYFTDMASALLYPPYDPDKTIDDSIWLQWINFVREQTANQEMAFPPFRPNELAPHGKVPYVIATHEDAAKHFKIDLDDSPLAKEWIDSQDFCVYVIKKYLNLDAPDVRSRNAWPCDVTAFTEDKDFINFLSRSFQSQDRNDIAVFKYQEDFWKGVENFESDSPIEETLLLALRDYWVTFQLNDKHANDFSGIGVPDNFYCNSSAFSRPLCEIATFLLWLRLPYTEEECSKLLR